VAQDTEKAKDMVKIAEHMDIVSLTPLTGDAILIDKLADANNLSIITEYQTKKTRAKILSPGS
jgi:alkyl hydroperoxide reductase subunit AhpF